MLRKIENFHLCLVIIYDIFSSARVLRSTDPLYSYTATLYSNPHINLPMLVLEFTVVRTKIFDSLVNNFI